MVNKEWPIGHDSARKSRRCDRRVIDWLLRRVKIIAHNSGAMMLRARCFLRNPAGNAGYWATMFVPWAVATTIIHGKFVHTAGRASRNLRCRRPCRHSPSGRSKPRGLPLLSRPVPAAEPVNSDALQSLLAAIRQDLQKRRLSG